MTGRNQHYIINIMKDNILNKNLNPSQVVVIRNIILIFLGVKINMYWNQLHRNTNNILLSPEKKALIK